MSPNNRRSSSHGFSKKKIAGFFSSCQPRKIAANISSFKTHLTSMLKMVNLNLRRLCSRLRWPMRRRHAKTKVVIRKFGRSISKEGLVLGRSREASSIKGRGGGGVNVLKSTPLPPHVRIATFNAAMFSMAPAVPRDTESPSSALDPAEIDIRGKAANDRGPKSILKQRSYGKSKLRVSINLPDNEISLGRCKQQLNSSKDADLITRIQRGKTPMMSTLSFPSVGHNNIQMERESLRSNRSVLDVLREVGADILALQNVKAEEEKGMRPLSELAEGLGMKYVFADSWAPEYGNAILSKWPIKRWRVQKIYDDTDFRNVLKATIEVPGAGEVTFHCTHLDHLDENWRMKQMSTILQSNDGPHILAGGLNALDETDYSAERWTDIVKYFEEIGKPTPKVDVMKFLKGKQYIDAKNFAGECESVVVVAKGQDVQGTCKYGTRVDYILASPNSPYKFVPGSYTVISSKGTSDHHIVKVDIRIVNENNAGRRCFKHRVVRMNKNSSKGIWKTNS